MTRSYFYESYTDAQIVESLAEAWERECEAVRVQEDLYKEKERRRVERMEPEERAAYDRGKLALEQAFPRGKNMRALLEPGLGVVTYEHEEELPHCSRFEDFGEVVKPIWHFEE